MESDFSMKTGLMDVAVFLDRDGVINEAGAFVTKPEEIRIVDGAGKGIKLLNELGLKVVVVTNQPQVARGLCTEEDVENINSRIAGELERDGARIDAFYYCPHHPETHHKDVPESARKYRITCVCRKPGTGMMERAAMDFNIDLKRSFVVGDRTVDIKSGENAGCRTILVQTGLAGKDGKCDAEPDFVAGSLYEASILIKDILTMKTLILVGGRGERLQPLTDNTPKPMLPVNGRPMLEYLIELNKRHGIKDIIMAGHYLFDKIAVHFGDGKRFGVNIEYKDDGEAPLGSGGALKNCEDLLPDNFIVLSGDVFTDINLWELIRFHFQKGGIATPVIRETDHPHDSDTIEVDGDFRAMKFHGKKSRHKVGSMANAGLFVFRKDIIDLIKDGKSHLESDVLDAAIGTGKVFCYINTEYYIKDMGTPERYEKVQGDVREMSL